MSLHNEAYQQAIKLLASREHSCNELNLKLMRRGYDSAHINEVITQLQQANLLSDARFAEMYVRMRKRRGYGPLRIQAELYERGISKEISDEFLSADTDEWLQLAKDVKSKKFGNRLVSDFNLLVKQKRFLQYRGFDMDVINRIFD